MLRRLILIDRASGHQESLEALLKEDFDLLCFRSVDHALDDIRDLRPHGIIIIDNDQPEETLRALRALDVSKELPLIVMGAGPSPEREVAAFQAGADDFISKESDPNVLKARLVGILRQSFTVKRLRSKLEEMDYFVRTVTHDLKNPISSILSCAELTGMALDAGDQTEARELTATIQRQSENALEFLQDLLSLLRNGCQLRDLNETPSEEVIAAALKELEMKIRSSGAIVTVPQSLPRITCDKRRMVQVFTNVLANAIKYVAKGVTPRITITTIETPHANTFVFGDNGIGMEAKDLKRIFQTFVRLPEAADYEGTGLGLSIVQRIVEAHEGDVFARSRKGIGSEFYVVLPTQLSFVHQPLLQASAG